MARGRIRLVSRTGALFCLASAAGFGASAVFGKLAYDEGSTVGTLLATRFTLAAILFWIILFASRGLGELRSIGRRDTLLALALGAVGYAAQAGCYFAALELMDASLLALLLYTYPVLVAVAAVVIGREEPRRSTALSLALALGGLVLVLAGASAGALDPLGTVLGLAAASIYTVYILVSDGVTARVGPLALSTLVCTGAAVSLTLAGLVGGDLDPGAVTAAGYGWLGSLAVVSTVGAIALFFAGLRLVGPTAAAILSTLEPAVTVALASAVFGESLGPAQLTGGLLVLAAVLTVRAPHRRQLALSGT
jgi:drug/metabolite transporter (DMT)-like permease